MNHTHSNIKKAKCQFTSVAGPEFSKSHERWHTQHEPKTLPQLVILQVGSQAWRKSIWVQEGQKAKCISPAQVYTKYTHWTRCKYHGLSSQHNCSCSCKAPKYGVFGYGTIQGYGCSPKTMTDILGKQLFLFFLLFARHTCGTALASRTSPWMQDRNSFPSLLLCHLQGS